MSDAGPALPLSPWPTAPPGAPGLKAGFPEVPHHVSHDRRLGHGAIIALVLGGLALLTVALVVVDHVATPGPAKPCPIFGCQGPPVNHPAGAGAQSVGAQADAGPPVETGTLYTSPTGFSLRYPGSPTVATSSVGVKLGYDFTQSGLSIIIVGGGPDKGLSAEGAVNDLVSNEFANAEEAYQVPDMLIGYQPGVGVALNVEGTNTFGATVNYRAFVAAAVSNGFLIEVILEGPLLPQVTTSSPYYNDHPSPAGTPLAYFGGDGIVNSITWP